MQGRESMDKDEKKAVKAAAKIAKKQAAAAAPPERSADRPSPDDPMSPAERSAQAAERQVELQKRRVWLALLGVLVGTAAVAVALYQAGLLTSPSHDSTPAATQPVESTDAADSP
jgi:hypothetical protein